MELELTKQTPPTTYISIIIAKRDAAMGVADFARRPCYLIPPPEFRSGALRPTLSSGLPLTGWLFSHTELSEITERLFCYLKNFVPSVGSSGAGVKFISHRVHREHRENIFFMLKNSEHSAGSVRDYQTMSKTGAKFARIGNAGPFAIRRST